MAAPIGQAGRAYLLWQHGLTLEAQLRNLSQDIRGKIAQAALCEQSRVYAKRMRENAPLGRSGILRESIFATGIKAQQGDPATYVAIRTGKGQAWYWHFVEYGTKYWAKGETRLTTGVAGGRAGVRKGRVKREHLATKFNPFIRRTVDDFYTKHEALQAAHNLVAKRVAAWQLRTARAMGRDLPVAA